MTEYTHRYFFADQGSIKHTLYKKSNIDDIERVCVEIDGKKRWFKTKEYIEQIKKLVQDYERNIKKDGK